MGTRQGKLNSYESKRLRCVCQQRTSPQREAVDVSWKKQLNKVLLEEFSTLQWLVNVLAIILFQGSLSCVCCRLANRKFYMCVLTTV